MSDPRNAADLREAIESLYTGGVDETVKAFEEFAFPGPSPGDDWPTYRMIIEQWRDAGTSEAELCAKAWKAMQEAAKGFEGSKLFWRVRPEVRHDTDFETFQARVSLRFRCGILPADWQARATVPSELEGTASWRRWFRSEGAPIERVRS